MARMLAKEISYGVCTPLKFRSGLLVCEPVTGCDEHHGQGETVPLYFGVRSFLYFFSRHKLRTGKPKKVIKSPGTQYFALKIVKQQTT